MMVDERWFMEVFSRGFNYGRSKGFLEYLVFMLRFEGFEGLVC